MWQVNYFFSLPFIGTNWFPPHSFVPTPALPSFYDLTSAHKHILPPIAEKFCLLFFSTIHPNTIANQQRFVIWYYEGRWNATSHDLSCLEAGHRPLEDLSVLTKFAFVQQVVRTCFCDCLTKCITRATRTNHKTTASLFS